MHILQMELDDVVALWNTHRIRRNSNNAGGMPDELHILSLLNGMTMLVHPSYTIDFRINGQVYIILYRSSIFQSTRDT